MGILDRKYFSNNNTKNTLQSTPSLYVRSGLARLYARSWLYHCIFSNPNNIIMIVIHVMILAFRQAIAITEDMNVA